MMRYKLSLIAFITILSTNAQTEEAQIKETLMHYIEGTANGEPERLELAFHPDFNLYFTTKDSLRTWSGKNYISRIKKGNKVNRIGEIIAIDYANNAASAKIEIDMPDRKRLYTDYLLLLKMKGKWKIIHKSFTYINYTD